VGIRNIAVVVLLVAALALGWTSAAGAQSPAQGPGGPILVVTDPDDPVGTYYAEILRAEGLNEFAVTTKANLTAPTLSGYQVVLLAHTSVTDAQASLLNGWVQGGGNLVAMRPEARLAGLLGLGADVGDLAEAYIAVNTGSPPGAGITAATMQFHGTADRWSGASAATVATLYGDADTPTSPSAPAVTLNSVGAAGGQAAAFTYDLAGSIVATRQGDIGLAGVEHDGELEAKRSDELFWPGGFLNLAKVAIPQADEQQRLLANLITQMNIDRAPLPRFWYLPRGEKAAVVLTGDDHAITNGTAGQFNRYADVYSPPGCSVALWECVRSTSYLFPAVNLSDEDAKAFEDNGFEIALHLRVSGPNTGAQECNDYISQAGLNSDLTSQLQAFHAKWPSLSDSVTNRTHCVVWSDWSGTPQVELQHGIRLDTNYYYWPAGFVGNRPGMFTGSGFPMRFTDTNGSMIDVYQAATQLTDESGQDIPVEFDELLNKALGPEGYYGVFTANMHTDLADHTGADAIVEESLERGVPVVSAKQMLTWIDGRNNSSFANVSFGGGLLRFSVARASGALGLETMVPASSPAGQVTQVVRNGAPVSVTRRTIKGIDYATFDSSSGDYVVAYGGATIPPPGTTGGAGTGSSSSAASGTTGSGQTSGSTGGGTTTADRKAPKVKIVKRTVRATNKGLVTLRVACPSGEVRCRVDLRLRRGNRQLVRKSLTVAGGKSASVTLRLTRSDRLRLVRVRSLLVDAAASARDVAGNHATTTTPIRLLAPRRR
jgi:hypothetical protein